MDEKQRRARANRPKGVYHPNKTAEDYSPVSQRPRVKAAELRLAKMNATRKAPA